MAVVSERFLSFAVDLDQVVGGTFWDPTGGTEQVPVEPYDFSRPRLRALTAALAPAYLRLGGSAADRIFYDLSEAPAEPPQRFSLVLTKAQFDAASQFATELGLGLIFTINAGPGPRDGTGRWDPRNAEELLSYALSRGYPFAALEFGNEPNLFAVRAGIAGYSAQEYARDLTIFGELRDRVAPGIPILAAGNVYMRTQGENVFGNFVFGPRMTEILPLVGGSIEGVNYHYYGAVSTRCPPSGPRVTIESALDPDYLDGIDEAAAAVDALRDQYSPGRPVWLTETGGQSCGGQVGVADRFANTFWYLNTLARLARRGHFVVVRQTLSGSTYGLIDDVSLRPRPDYWATFLWRRLMGTRVLEPPLISAAVPARIYAHCQHNGPAGGVTLLVLNLSREGPLTLRVADLGLQPPANVYLASSTDLASHELHLNGEPLSVATDGAPPEPTPLVLNGPTVTLPATSWAFVVFPEARVASCLDNR
ncbi:MAG: hypothetical protein N3C12_02025 [Candidatus Binatia bacterium]|nr:hypothetical protein [Candidatus Binatia bacterium]